MKEKRKYKAVICIGEPMNALLGRYNVCNTKEDYKWAASREQAYTYFAREYPDNEILEISEVFQPDNLQGKFF